jgi:hypothetical protein
MDINEKVTIIISEPWGYTTPEGGNKFSAIVLNKTTFNRTKSKSKPVFEDAFLLKIDVPFIMDELNVNYIMAEYRNKEADSKGFNIYYIPDAYINQFMTLDNIIEKLKFIIIGSIKKKDISDGS